MLAYEDPAQAWLEAGTAGGRFRGIRLRPHVRLAAGTDPARARALHDLAHERCFIANSCSAPIQCEPSFSMAGEDEETLR